MNVQPFVSVNVTTYNRAEKLNRCLLSIISQTYKDLEIVVVDDGSIDNTELLVRKLINIDNRIKYIKHKLNKGNAAARNTALRNSQGKYIAFMDDDDEWIDNDKLKKQVELYEKSDDKLGLICTSVLLIDENGNKKEKLCRKPDNLEKHILKTNGIIYSPTVLTKKAILEEVGGFDDRMPRGVDSDFYRTCILKYGYKVHFMKDLTTAIHEYGNDRMTPKKSCSALKRENDAIKLLLNKYSKEFKQYKRIKYKRYFTIIKNSGTIFAKRIISLWKKE